MVKKFLMFLLVTSFVFCALIVNAEYNEAPMLAGLVKEGKLPSVEERLPKNPVVVEPLDGIGRYSDTWRTWSVNTLADWWWVGTFKYERLIRQNPDMSFGLLPDLAESYEVSEDKKVTSYKLREGLKWSDGAPFTTADVEFYWNDLMNNDELAGVLGLKKVNAELAVIDEYNFQVRFKTPNGVFQLLNSVAIRPSILWHFFPQHYLKAFHTSYATQAQIDAEMKKLNLDSWPLLFKAKADYARNPELPQISSWVLEKAPDESGRVVVVRNPYYYKVDPEGNQLPYIDRIIMEKFANKEVAIVKTISGEIDYHMINFRANDIPTLKQNEAKGDYIVGGNRNAKGGELSIFINLSTDKPQLAPIFNDVRFRQAMSVALNRQEIVDTVFIGLGAARQMCPLETDPLYDPEWVTWYAEYNPEQANQLLDEMGLDKRGDDGFRLGLDGKPLKILFDWSTHRQWDDAYQLMVEYWQAVGVNVISNPNEISVHGQRVANNEFDINSDSIIPAVHVPLYLTPIQAGGGTYAPAWGNWLLTEGKSGKEPPGPVLKMKELVDKALFAGDADELVSLLKEAGEIHKQNLYAIGIMGADLRPQVVHKRMKNVRMDDGPGVGSFTGAPSMTHQPEQFWVDKDWKP